MWFQNHGGFAADVIVHAFEPRPSTGKCPSICVTWKPRGLNESRMSNGTKRLPKKICCRVWDFKQSDARILIVLWENREISLNIAFGLGFGATGCTSRRSWGLPERVQPLRPTRVDSPDWLDAQICKVRCRTRHVPHRLSYLKQGYIGARYWSVHNPNTLDIICEIFIKLFS